MWVSGGITPYILKFVVGRISFTPQGRMPLVPIGLGKPQSRSARVGGAISGTTVTFPCLCTNRTYISSSDGFTGLEIMFSCVRSVACVTYLRTKWLVLLHFCVGEVKG